MRKVTLTVGILLLFVSTVSAEWVRGYTRRDGTYVHGYQRSSPDNTRTNNYGPSTNYYDKTNLYSRDSDRDGTANYLDRDDNNDGRSDDYKTRGY